MLLSNKPKISLVGAGPGDPDLITVKGAKALASADVVMYDALVSKELLSYAPSSAKKIFVGKRKGYHTYSQDEINDKLVANAFSYGHVVRLKGGDPFVFGRGSEEMDYAENFGIDVEVIPGLTSAFSVPACMGIPVTRRLVAESVWVLTGTTVEGKFSNDIALAAKSTATVVILMGMGHFSKIIQLFKNNRKGDAPIAIIQNGTTTKERVATGSIDNIKNEIIHQKIGSPAVIVIGEVVRHSHKFKQFYLEIMKTYDFRF